jgi:transposase
MDEKDKQKNRSWVFPLDWYGDMQKTDDTKEKLSEDLQRAERETYSQDWKTYNSRQTLEMYNINNLLHQYLGKLPVEDLTSNGRPRASLKDITLIGVNIQYMSISTRRVYSHTELLSKSNLISHPYHFNTISKYVRDKSLTPMLERLIELTAVPLALFEEMLAIDATGIGKHFFSHWCEDRTNYGERQRDYLKLHVIAGAKTGTILSAIVTDPHVADTTQFSNLLLNASRIVDIKNVSADKAYLSRKNIDLTFELGGIPFIPFKLSCTGKSGGSLNWKKMYSLYIEHHDVFMQHYHLRSNVEAVFSTMKRITPRKLMTGSFPVRRTKSFSSALHTI